MLKFFGLNKDGTLVEIPYQIVPDDFDEKNLLARISELTDNDKLASKRVVFIGCGSLGSATIQGLAGTGIRNFLLCDMDTLSDVNIIRHIGGIYDLGRNKTDILKDYIEAHNPLAYVQTINDDLLKNRKLLRAIIEYSDIVVAASGNPELNYHINSICIELNKPAVYGGIYAKAESAYVFSVPGNNSACFDCIFELTSAAIDQNTINRKYGLEDGELHQAHGMFADICIPANMMVKMTLWLLLGQQQKFNRVRYFDDLTVRRQSVPRRKLCPTCDYGNWLANEQKELECKDISKPKRILRKVKKKLDASKILSKPDRILRKVKKRLWRKRAK